MRIKSNSDVIRDSDTNRERAKYISIFFWAERGNGATYIQGEPAEDAGKDLNTIREKKYVQDETQKNRRHTKPAITNTLTTYSFPSQYSCKPTVQQT